MQEVTGKCTNTQLSGPEMFGFAHPTIAKLIQEMPGAEKCDKYIPQQFVPSSSKLKGLDDKPKKIKRKKRKSESELSSESEEDDWPEEDEFDEDDDDDDGEDLQAEDEEIDQPLDGGTETTHNQQFHTVPVSFLGQRTEVLPSSLPPSRSNMELRSLQISQEEEVVEESGGVTSGQLHPVQHLQKLQPVQQLHHPPLQPIVLTTQPALQVQPPQSPQSLQSPKSLQSPQSLQSPKALQSPQSLQSPKSLQSPQSLPSLQQLLPTRVEQQSIKTFPSQDRQLPLLQQMPKLQRPTAVHNVDDGVEEVIFSSAPSQPKPKPSPIPTQHLEEEEEVIEESGGIGIQTPSNVVSEQKHHQQHNASQSHLLSPADEEEEVVEESSGTVH